MRYCSFYAGVSLLYHALGIYGQAPTLSWKPSIIGIGFRPSSTQTLTAKKPWLTDGNVAGDCTDTERCALATACKDGKVVYQGDITSTCTAKTKCFILTMYESPPNIGPVVYNYGCRMGWPNTVYRDLKAAVATTRPAAHSTISAGSQALPSPTRSRSGLVLETSASQDSTESTIPDDNSGGSKSKAWIAGAVVGPIAGLVLLGGGILFWFRRRRNKTVKIAPVYELDESQQRPFEKYSHFGKPVGSYNTSTLAELPPETRPVELPAGR